MCLKPRIEKVLGVLAVLMLFLGGAPTAGTKGQTQALGVFEPAECIFEFPIISFIRPDWLGVECGYVTVPERHESPENGGTIRLAVAILPSQAEQPAPDPLFMAQGGPGGSSLEIFPLLMLGSPIRQERDIVIFDQRGTLYSEPNLLCPELDQLTRETIEQDLRTEEADALAIEAYQACGERLREEGIDLAAYNSPESAADLEMIRTALGYGPINFYGVSYGTLLGLHTMRLFPEGLRAVILDAVVPAQGSFLAETAQSADRAFKEVAQLCASDPECNAAYPNLEDTIYEVMAELNEEPVTIPVAEPESGQRYQASVNGDLFLNTIFLAMYDPLLLPALPSMIYNAQAGNYDLLASLLPVIFFQPTFSIGMYQTVVCTEEADFDPAEMPVEGVRPELAELMREDNATLLEICELWGISQLGPEVGEPVSSDIPTLLLSGQFDPITPPAFAEAAAKTLNRAYVYTFPTTSHGAFLSSVCADQIVLAFLANPYDAPEADCIPNEPTRFDIPTPQTVIITPAMWNLLQRLNGPGIGSVGLLLLTLLGLLSFFIVWPLLWLVRRLSGRPTRSKQPGPVIGWGAPLLVTLMIGIGGLFVLGLVILVMVVDLSTLAVGVPKTSIPLFILPLLLLPLAAGIVVIALLSWFRDYWSLWRRLYYSFLTGLVLIFTGILIQWGMMTALL
jgi:pimeloyl-ACP methyl ester carboxylesterase